MNMTALKYNVKPNVGVRKKESEFNKILRDIQ